MARRTEGSIGNPHYGEIVFDADSQKTWDLAAGELLCRALRIGGVALRGANEFKCDVLHGTQPPRSCLPTNPVDTYTEFNQGVGVDLFLFADSDAQVFECLNIVDLATRITICFPVLSKSPDDDLSVLEMVWQVPP